MNKTINMKMQASKKVLEACFSCGRLDMLIWGRLCLENPPASTEAPPLPAFAWQMFGVETQAMQLEWNNMEHPVSLLYLLVWNRMVGIDPNKIYVYVHGIHTPF